MLETKNPSTLCITGWGQKFDSLEQSFSESFFVSSLNYAKFNSVSELFLSVSSQNINPEIVIGWSLGGQLAIRLIENKIISPKILVLLAPPFQMVKDNRIYAGMAPKTYDDFYSNFNNAPSQTLKRFAILSAMNDKNAKEIANGLDISEENFEELKFWLEELRRFSCFDVDFSKMPRTLFFQGAGDMIVHASQANYFKERIKNFRLEIISNCGHAPHLNNSQKILRTLSEEINLFDCA